MTLWVVDADVGFKWHVEQPDSDQAERVLALGGELHAPDFQYLEVRQVLAKYVRMNLISSASAMHAQASHRSMIAFWHDHKQLADHAFDLALKHSHAFYDCLYLALALRLNGRLVTADKAFARKFADGEHAGRIVLLQDFAG
ncbi:MAG TPA: type II toxin-antitoxin system VapC family toxin [Rhizobiaceae bacterium]|nr:type II toxin-antitoxin system VapC family toxin [Rhizobiaceae bacterium]